MTLGAGLIRGDALRIPLRDNSVDLIVTSPPYFALRSYRDGGEHYDGQIGSEATPQAFLEALWAVTAECKRVLKPSGSMFVNLGDKYAAGHGGSSTEGNGVTIHKRVSQAGTPRERPDLPNPPASWGTRDVTGRNVVPGFRPKSLMLLPEAYRLGCTGMLAALGGHDPGLNMIARAVVIWDKPNGLPESVTDRVRRSHEDWVHLTKAPRYYAAVDEIREEHTWKLDVDPKWAEARERTAERRGAGHRNGLAGGFTNPANPLGKLPGSVWRVPSEPLQVPEWVGVDHYASFPQEWPRRLILGWSPPGYCTACGKGRIATVERSAMEIRPSARRLAAQANGGASRTSTSGTVIKPAERRITGYRCACPTPDAPTRPAVILDPFAGTGTTVMVARALGRYGVGIDLSADYLRLARWRVFQSGHAAKTERRTWTERQGEMFG